MDVNSLPKTVTRQRRDCDLNPGLSAPESSTLTNHSATEPSKSLSRQLNIKRLQRFGSLQYRMTVAQLMNKSDHDLVCELCAPTHALNHLLPPARNRASLRTRGHSYQLPEYSTDLHKKSFLLRCLYIYD